MDIDTENVNRTKSPSDNDRTLLAEIRERFEDYLSYWSPYYAQAEESVRFVLNGEQWDEKALQERKRAGLPCLTFNELAPMVIRVANKTVEARPKINYVPVDANSDPAVAEIWSMVAEHTEKLSSADDVYRNAVLMAASGCIGWFRLVPEYKEASFEQHLVIRPINNINCVLLDPMSILPNGSDAKCGFVYTEMRLEDFKAEYPKAEVSSFDIAPQATTWTPFRDKTQYVTVAEYFKIVDDPVTLVMYANGDVCYKEDGDPPPLDVEGKPFEIEDERSGTRKRCRWVKTNGSEILEDTFFPGPYIPLFPVIGHQFWINGERHLQSVTHHAQQPQRAYNMGMSNYTEILAAAPKAPFVAVEGQIDDYEDEWKNSAVDNTAVLTYKNVAINGTLSPPPQRIAPIPVPQALVDMVNNSQRAIQQATGIHEAFMGEHSNERTGAAIQQRRMGTDLSIQHLAFNLESTLVHLGRVMLYAFRELFDAPRVMRLTGDAEKATMVKADPQQEQVYQELLDERGRIIQKAFNPTLGMYDVRPLLRQSYETRRQEATAFFTEIIRASPASSQLLGDLMVKNYDFQGANEAAKRLKRAVPPAVLSPDDVDDDVLSQQADQMAQMQSAIEQFQAQLQQLSDEHAAVLKQAEQLKGENLKLTLDNHNLKVGEQVALLQQQLEKARLDHDTKKLAIDAELGATKLGNEHMKIISEMEARANGLGLKAKELQFNFESVLKDKDDDND